MKNRIYLTILFIVIIKGNALALNLRDIDLTITLKSISFKNKFSSYSAEIIDIMGIKTEEQASIFIPNNHSKKINNYGGAGEISYRIYQSHSNLVYTKLGLEASFDNSTIELDLAEKDREKHKIYKIALVDHWSFSPKVKVGLNIIKGTSVYGFIGCKMTNFKSKYIFDNDTIDNDPAHENNKTYYKPGFYFGAGVCSKLSEKLKVVTEISHTKYQNINIPDYSFKIDASDMIVRNQKHNPSSFSVKVGLMMNLNTIKSVLQ